MVEALWLYARWWLMGCAVVASGCANHAASFTVATGGKNPLIYVPGTAPKKTLHVPLEGVKLTCDQAVVSVSSPQLTFLVTKRIRLRASGLKMMAVASISASDAVRLAKAPNSHAELLNAFLGNKPSGCGLDTVAPIAATEIRRQLPIPYSAVLRDAYNHQVWPKQPDVTTWISLDLQPGMRLRVENSLPISPNGINSTDTHPSSFAAPTFVYFHSLTGAELCDSGAKLLSTDDNLNCGDTEFLTSTFVSASSGLVRLGLYQPSHAPPKPKQAQPASGLIDLQERAGKDEGAWRYWRLWIPAQRKTNLNTSISSGRSGATEAVNSAPLLMMAKTLNGLANLGPKGVPCESSDYATWRCRSLHFRAVPIPEIAITIKGVSTWVPVGTTLGEVLEDRWHERLMSEALSDARSYRLSAQRNGLAEIELLRRDQGVLRPVVPSSLKTTDELSAFLRIQLLPGDEIRCP